MKKVISFIKRETVLCVALVLAAVSCFFVRPDAQYLSYIDLSTLSLLFCLMAVMAGLKSAGVFSACAKVLLKKTSSTRSVTAVLILLCFFLSALITNDVALITFVPFAITVLRFAGRDDLIPFTVVMQTVAANMGSCMTPIGNPQNIYIYSISDMTFGEFFLTMLPFAGTTLAVLVLSLFVKKNSPVVCDTGDNTNVDKKKTALYCLLFAVSLLGVLKILGFVPCLITVLAALLVFDRKTLLCVDYSLLLTFVGFFIFVGNMGRVPFFHDLIVSLIEGREVLFSALVSQIISNVPAALLLSSFTSNLKGLLIGVNIGGLGTLIASMASLISYKYIAAECPDKKGRYLLLFSAVNFGLLGVMLAVSCI